MARKNKKGRFNLDTQQWELPVKVIAAMLLPEFCERCFYLQMWGAQAPWDIFLGALLGIMDSYTKNSIHAWIDDNGGLPLFARGLGINCTGYVDLAAQACATLNWVDPKTNILLTGKPDEIIRTPTGYWVLDYKTTKVHSQPILGQIGYNAALKSYEAQQTLHKMYDAQVNSYAFMLQQLKGWNVEGTGILSFSADKDREGAQAINSAGLSLSFTAHSKIITPFTNNPVLQLLPRVANILDGSLPKVQIHNGEYVCEDCKRISYLTDLIKEKDAAE